MRFNGILLLGVVPCSHLCSSSSSKLDGIIMKIRQKQASSIDDCSEKLWQKKEAKECQQQANHTRKTSIKMYQQQQVDNILDNGLEHCLRHLASIQSSRMERFLEFERTVEDGQNQIVEHPNRPKAYAKGISTYSDKIKEPMRKVRDGKNDDIHTKCDLIFILIALRHWISHSHYFINQEKKIFSSTNPPSEDYVTGYIDALLNEIASPSFILQDNGPFKPFVEKVGSLNIIQNYISLIAECQEFLKEHYRKKSDICRYATSQIINKNKTSMSIKRPIPRKSIIKILTENEGLTLMEASKIHIMRLINESRMRCKIRIDYMQKCNNVLRSMLDEIRVTVEDYKDTFDGVTPTIDGCNIVLITILNEIISLIEESNGIDKGLKRMHGKHAVQPDLSWIPK